MKKLKITLGDNKNYTFATFSISEQIALRKQFKNYMKIEEDMNKMKFEWDESKDNFKRDENSNLISKKLTDEQQLKIEEMEETNVNYMIDIVRKSLCKNHPDFAKNSDKDKDSEIIEKIKNMVDLSDLRDLTFFAFNGIYTPTSNEVVIDVTIPQQ